MYIRAQSMLGCQIIIEPKGGEVSEAMSIEEWQKQEKEAQEARKAKQMAYLAKCEEKLGGKSYFNLLIFYPLRLG